MCYVNKAARFQCTHKVSWREPQLTWDGGHEVTMSGSALVCPPLCTQFGGGAGYLSRSSVCALASRVCLSVLAATVPPALAIKLDEVWSSRLWLVLGC